MTENISLPRVRPRFAMSLILVLGSTACLWLFLYGGNIVAYALGLLDDSSQESIRKKLIVCTDGQVIKEITESDTSSSIVSTRYETLEGQAIPEDQVPSQLKVSDAYLRFRSPQEKNSVSATTTLNILNILSFRNSGQPDEYWYFYYKLNDQFQWVGYFEVFDRRNNKRLFYLGRNGKTETYPASEDRFEFQMAIGRSWDRPFLNEPANTGVVPSGSDNQFRREEGRTRPILLLSTSGEIWQINVPTQAVEVLPVSNPVQGVSLHDFKFLEREEEDEKKSTTAKYWYTRKEITIQGLGDPARIYTLKIPEALQQQSFLTFNLLPEGVVLYNVSEKHPETMKIRIDLYWADRDGNIVKEHLAALEISYNSPIRESLTTNLVMWPYPILFTVALFTESETGPTHFVFSTQELFWQNLQVGWDLAIFIYGLAIVLTIVYWLRCRQKKQPQVWWHLLFVLAFGPLGYFSLWLQQKSTPADLPELAEERLGIDVIHPLPSSENSLVMA